MRSIDRFVRTSELGSIVENFRVFAKLCLNRAKVNATKPENEQVVPDTETIKKFSELCDKNIYKFDEISYILNKSPEIEEKLSKMEDIINIDDDFQNIKFVFGLLGIAAWTPLLVYSYTRGKINNWGGKNDNIYFYVTIFVWNFCFGLAFSKPIFSLMSKHFD